MDFSPSEMRAVLRAESKPLIGVAEAHNPAFRCEADPSEVAPTPDLTVTLRPAYQIRLFAERDELATRLAALQAFIKSDNFTTVDTDEQHRLLRQELSMIEYLAVLNERVAAL